jgi:CRISPR/Cas system-associated exonuclease Cas4 (RecB family)
MAYFSHWAWEKLKTCPRQYYLRLIQKVPEKKGDQGNAIQGSVPHALAEMYFSKSVGKRDLNVFVDEFESVWDAELAKITVDWKAQADRYAKNLLTVVPDNYAEWAFNLKKADARKYSITLMHLIPSSRWDKLEAQAEISFKESVSKDLQVGGRMDLVFDVDGKKEIWDIKSTTKPEYLDKDQLIIYSMAGRSKGWDISNVGYALIALGTLQPKVITEANEKELKTKMVKTLKAAEASQWPAKVDKRKCDWCGVHDHCSLYTAKRAKKEELQQIIARPEVVQPEIVTPVKRVEITSAELDRLLGVV